MDLQNNINNNKSYILITADLYLNIIDGSSIWWSNLINTLILDGKNIIYLSNYKITNDLNIKNLENIENVQIINPYQDKLNGNEIKHLIEEYNINLSIEKIIIKSNELLDVLDLNWNLLDKCSIYSLNIHLENIIKLSNKFNELWCQSEKLKELYVSNGIEENKIQITHPIAFKYNFEILERTDDEIRLIYVGTIRDEENILDIIEEYKKIKELKPEVVLTICYGKITGTNEFKEKVNLLMKENIDGLKWKHNLTHKECCYQIACSDIGICWKKNEYVEESLKEKEYNLYGIKIVYDLNKFLGSKINVLMIIGDINTSNASSIQVKSLVKNFSTNINIFFYICNTTINLDSIDEYSNYKKINESDKIIYLTNEIKTIDETENLIANNKFDLIFAWSNPYISSTLATYLGTKYNIPFILRLGDFYISKYEPSNKKLYEYIKANTIIVPNEILALKLINFYGNESYKKIQIISQHFEEITYIKNTTNNDTNNDKINIIHTGNMYLERKIDNFIKAFSKIDNELINKTNIIFIGCHDKLDDDIKLSKELNVSCNFDLCYKFIDWSFPFSLKYEEIRKIILDKDILIHIEYIEEDNHFLSFKLIDYLSYNKPIITITQKYSPNYYLAKKCGFCVADIQCEQDIIQSITSIINDPTKYIPDNNIINEYNVNNIVKIWENIIKNEMMNNKNYSFINLLKNNTYNKIKLNEWLNEMELNSYQNNNKTFKKYESIYTIYVLTTPFSNNLIHTINNLNYIGYKYKIILNDSELDGLNYILNNCETKYFFRLDDDFILIKKSIEYMVNIMESNVNNDNKTACMIFRLYDPNFGYKFKVNIDCYGRYGIKIHNTVICKKFLYDCNYNSDLFYNNLQNNGYKIINYREWENNNGMIVGFHDLFYNSLTVFLIFVKLSYKYLNFKQDEDIFIEYLNKYFKTRKEIINCLTDFSNKYNINVDILNTAFLDIEYCKTTIINKEYLKLNKNWLENDNNYEFNSEKYDDFNFYDYYKIAGIIYGIKNKYLYTDDSLNEFKIYHDNLFFNNKEQNDILIILNDINIYNDNIKHIYDINKNKNIKLYSIKPIVTIIKYNLHDLIKIQNINELINLIINNEFAKIHIDNNIDENLKKLIKNKLKNNTTIDFIFY